MNRQHELRVCVSEATWLVRTIGCEQYLGQMKETKRPPTVTLSEIALCQKSRS